MRRTTHRKLKVPRMQEDRSTSVVRWAEKLSRALHDEMQGVVGGQKKGFTSRLSRWRVWSRLPQANRRVVTRDELKVGVGSACVRVCVFWRLHGAGGARNRLGAAQTRQGEGMRRAVR